MPARARAAVDRVLEAAAVASGSSVEQNGGGSGSSPIGGGERRGAADGDGDGDGGGSSPADADDDHEGTRGPASADQITVNDYPPGSGIAPHVDTHSAFTSRFASLSLGAGVAFELRRGGEAADLWLPRRSLLLLGAEARLGWAHYIAPRRGDSVSREVAGVDAEVASAVALAEERERAEAEEGESASGGGRGEGEGEGASASSPPPSTTVVIPRRRRVSITIRQVRWEAEKAGGWDGSRGRVEKEGEGVNRGFFFPEQNALLP